MKVSFLNKDLHQCVQKDRPHQYVVKDPETSVLQNDVLVGHVVQHHTARLAYRAESRK